jgi:uncharacterized membrane protein
MTYGSPLRPWIFLFLIEFAAVLWAQFLFGQGAPVSTYVGLNLLVIGCNVFAVASEVRPHPLAVPC